MARGRKRMRGGISRGRYAALSQLLRQEKKFSDSGAIAFYNTGTTWPLNGQASETEMVTPTTLSTGTGVSERIGNKIAVMSLQGKFDLAAHGTNSCTNGIHPSISVRIVVACDKKRASAAALPLATDFYDQVGSVSSVLSMRNMNNTQRFRILYDRIHILHAIAGGNGPGASNVDVQVRYPNKVITFFKKFKKPIVMKWKSGSNSANGSDVEENNLISFIEVLDPSDTAAANVMCHGQFRIRYTDA